MLKDKLLKSLTFLLIMIGMTSCYTRLGYVNQEPVYEDYGYEGEAAGEEYADDADTVGYYEEDYETDQNSHVVPNAWPYT